MTELQLLALKAGTVPAFVNELQKSSYPSLPKWEDLKKQYNPGEHIIWDTNIYPAKTDKNGVDEFKRTSFALQKLAVKRIAQAMFSIPVTRMYNYETDSEQAQKAVDIMEEVYRTLNFIDSDNISRAKKLNASCQIATVWRTRPRPVTVKGETSQYTLLHSTYCEKDGYKLYPILDEYGELLAISIHYTDADKLEQMDTYLNTEKPEYIKFKNESGWVVDAEVSKPLEVFPVVYANIEEPVWGYDDGTNLIEQLEEMMSYSGLYIKKNNAPLFTIDYGELRHGATKSTSAESSDDSRRLVELGKGGKMEDQTWKGADAATSFRYDVLRNAFFEQAQVPDTSFHNMIKSNTSAENKELIFSDAKANAKDLGGTWEKLFLQELTIVSKFLQVMFPRYSTQYAEISVRSTINPYTIRTKKENAEYVATGGVAMSLDTQIRVLGEVDNVEDEKEKIQESQSAQSNILG